MAIANDLRTDALMQGRPPLKKLKPKNVMEQAAMGALAGAAAPAMKPPLRTLPPKTGLMTQNTAAPVQTANVAQGQPGVATPPAAGGKPPLRSLRQRRDETLSGMGIDPGTAQKYADDASSSAKALDMKVRQARIAKMELMRNKTLDPMARAQQIAALNLPEIESQWNDARRAAAKSRMLVTPSAADQTPEERLAAREALNAQLPGIKAKLAGDADRELELNQYRQNFAAMQARKAADQRSADFRYPGGMLPESMRGEGERLAGEIRDTQAAINPDTTGALEGRIAAGDGYSQWSNAQKQAGLERARQRLLAMRGEAQNIPTRINFGPDTTDTGAPARLAAELGTEIGDYGRRMAQGRAIETAQGDAALAEAQGAARIAGLQPDLVEAQIGTEKAKANAATSRANTESIVGQTENIQANRALADTQANFNEVSIRNAAAGFSSQIAGAGSLTLPYEAISSVQAAYASIVEPLKKLAATGKDGAARARAIAQEIANQLPTPWSLAEGVAGPTAGTSLMRQGIAQIRHDLLQIGS